MLQKEQNLISKCGQLVRRHLGDEIIGDLVLLVVCGQTHDDKKIEQPFHEV